MVLLDDVHLTSGLLLAGRGYEVTASFLERVRNFRKTGDTKPARAKVPRAGNSVPAAAADIPA